MLKVLAMIQDKDYSVSVDSDKHILTVITNGEKKKLKKARRKVSWVRTWKKLRDWYDRKGYWVGVLLFIPNFGLTVGSDTATSIMAGIALDIWMIVFLMCDERK